VATGIVDATADGGATMVADGWQDRALVASPLILAGVDDGRHD